MADGRQRVWQVFMEVAELPEPARKSALARACQGDATLRAEVEALLRVEQQAGGFMGRATGDGTAISAAAPTLAAAPSEQQGQMIGRYKLLQPIGEGGFGSVWMAEQREPMKRRVALKIIKLGMDTRQVIARFEAERQALAMMDHPNIAKVLDAGTTETGRPYFVMEYIKGVPILEYCDTDKLDTKARLELFSSVCHAIQHAHQKGIIHRDIKPSNVLVTMHDGAPVPKVIDFGIAKATNSELTTKTLFTEHRHMIGTPTYMSPEQAEMSGLDIDTRSDIYSLGVLLYELLTGTTPFAHEELTSKGFAEMMRIIREVEPHKPSTRLSSLGDIGTRTAQQRHAVDARKLGLLLRGDLDWIVMKCLEKDRTRRYETANGLAADIQRHLSGEAVLAAPPDAWYRMGRVARRHRMALLTAGLVGAALVTGLALMSYGFVQANRERDQARSARARAEEAGRRNVEQSILAQRVSDLLMSRFLRPVPFGESADSVARTVEKEAEEIFGVGRPEVSAMLSGVGAMLSTDITREQEAKVLLHRAIEYQRKSLGNNDQSLVMPYLVMGAMSRWTDQPATLRYCREVLRLGIESHGEESLAAASAREGLALCMINGQRKEEYGEIIDLYKRVIPVYEKELGALHARTLDSKMACGQILMAQSKYDEGGAMMLDAFEKARSVPDTNPRIRFSTAASLKALYSMRKDKGREVAMIRDIVPIATEVLGERSDGLKRFLTRWAGDLRRIDETEEAERLDATVRQMDSAATSPAAMLSSAWAAFDTAAFASAQDKAAELLKTMPAPGPETTPWDRFARFSVVRLWIESMARAGHGAKAEGEARELLGATESRYGTAHGCTVLARWTLGEVLLAASQREAGEQMLRSAVQAALDRRPKDFDAVSGMLTSLSDSLKDQGDSDAAAAVTAQFQTLWDERNAGPIVGGFEGEDVGAPPAGWILRRVLVNGGFLCVVCDKGARTGERCLRVGGFTGADKAFEASRNFRNLMQSFDARPYRGKKVRLSAAVRLEAAGSSIAEARLWMRADRPNNASPNMFDNMGDRPVEPGDWKVFEITGVVDADANDIVLGLMVFGEATAWVDDVRFEVAADDGDGKP